MSYAVRRVTSVRHPYANIPRLIGAGDTLTRAREVWQALSLLHPEYRFVIEETTVKIIDPVKTDISDI